MPLPTKTRTLSTAEERRAAVLEAGRKVYAARGFHGTPTLEVAKAAGISQAYLFRLYPTKNDLAIALVADCNARIYRTFASAAAQAKATAEDPLQAMGAAYVELISDRDTLLLQLHAQAASASNPQIRDEMRASFARLHALVRTETGAGDEEIGHFFATGMLLNVLGALDAFELDADWVRAAMCVPGGDDQAP